MAASSTTTINDLPDIILSDILATITDTRTRNSVSLVSERFYNLERATRTSMTLRGNACNLNIVPLCFDAVTNLDLSNVSPWGHSLLFSPSPSSMDPRLVADLLQMSFPSVTSLTVYCRLPLTLEIILPMWKSLSHVKLVRWHPRPPAGSGAEFVPLLKHCKCLTSVDLSSFYHWAEDLPPVLKAHPDKSAILTSLNLLTTSFSEGYRSQEIIEVTAACPNLNKFLVACVFDPRCFGFVSDETLSAIATNCPKLTLLHLAETSTLAALRGDPDNDGFTAEDARISKEGLIKLFNGLPLLEELALDVGKNVRDSGLALEALKSRCVNLKVLKLGQLHGVCLASNWKQLDGVALLGGLESLSIKNCGDLSDMSLVAIGRGCSKLVKFEVEGCKNITVDGLRTLACLLRDTLVEVKIYCCKNLGAVASCKALEPIRDRIQKLHIDCVWDGIRSSEAKGPCFDLNELMYNVDDELQSSRKRKHYFLEDSLKGKGVVNHHLCMKRWKSLKELSLWIEVGELLTPLPVAGLDECPVLENIRIKMEGDTREKQLVRDDKAWGLSCLTRYPRLSKLLLHFGDTDGYNQTAPYGASDLSVWDRFLLNGIGNLTLKELDYWPAKDPDINQRSLSWLAAALIGNCITLRKVFIHGTAHEHFMSMLISPSPNTNKARDAQIRLDYYPAPDGDDSSTEMRVGSHRRFEDAINARPTPD